MWFFLSRLLCLQSVLTYYTRIIITLDNLHVTLTFLLNSIAIAFLIFFLLNMFSLFPFRLKCERERLYIFSLPQNTELTSSEEDNARYNTMTDFTRLFSGSSAERLSSCVYQDITDMVSSEFSSPRSTYQQIPFRHSKQSNSEEAKFQDLATFI